MMAPIFYPPLPKTPREHEMEYEQARIRQQLRQDRAPRSKFRRIVDAFLPEPSVSTEMLDSTPVRRAAKTIR